MFQLFILIYCVCVYEVFNEKVESITLSFLS